MTKKSSSTAPPSKPSLTSTFHKPVHKNIDGRVSSVDWPSQPSELILGDTNYPALLALCSAAPKRLFCIGDFRALSDRAIAVVGTRNPSADGLRAAYELSHDLALAGFIVVSGLARGIDTAAHWGALRAGGRTIAVMATGLDRVYPNDNYKLALATASSGTIVTEFMQRSAPHRWHFPRRNRTISGLTLATVVVEAGRPSGSLLTATAAAEQGREVFAYPWSKYHRAGDGCRWLLSQGAQMASCAEDVVSGLGPALEGLFELSATTKLDLKSGSAHAENCINGSVALAPSSVSSPADALVTLIGDGEIELAQLSTLTDMSTEELLIQLGRLELEGRILSTAQGYRRLT